MTVLGVGISLLKEMKKMTLNELSKKLPVGGARVRSLFSGKILAFNLNSNKHPETIEMRCESK